MQPEYSVLVVSSQVVAEVTDVPYSVKSRHYSVDSFQVTHLFFIYLYMCNLNSVNFVSVHFNKVTWTHGTLTVLL